MAIITRRYRHEGMNGEDIKLRTDMTLTCPAQKYCIFADVTFDDTIADAASVDAAMALYGFEYDASTVGLAPDPFFGIKSPDGSVWELLVDNAGALTTAKRTP